LFVHQFYQTPADASVWIATRHGALLLNRRRRFANAAAYSIGNERPFPAVPC